MATPARALSNDYKDCHLIKLDATDPASPLVVAQEAYDPADPNCRTRVFYLQHDGFWIDEIARSARPEEEIGDTVFETAAEALQLLGRLAGKPLVRQLPVTDADIQAYIARARSGSAEELFRQFLVRYRASKAKGNA